VFDTVTTDTLNALEIYLPPFPEQRAIVHILGALDDKIELNRRMNETLEGIARAIFKSWFVDFDPVWARVDGEQPYGMDAETAALFPDAFVDSELGPIPEGWRVGTLGGIAKNPRRGVQPDAVQPDTPYIGLQHMPQKSIALAEWGEAQDVTSNKFSFAAGEILFGKLRPYFHKVGVAPVDGVCSTDILVITPTLEEWHGVVLCYVSSEEFVNYTTAVLTGTRMPRTNWRDMSRYEIALPPPIVAATFGRLVLPLVDAIRNNILQSRTLAQLRDTMLPKLISGQLRVPEVEEIV
jgi:type I restriction enzyme S subunit